MNDNTQSQIQKNEDTIKLGEIAEVKEIFLHEIQAEDLIISSTLEYMGKENPHLRPVMTVFDKMEYLALKKWMEEERGCPSPQYFEFCFEGKTLSTKNLTTKKPEEDGGILRAVVYVLRLNEKGLNAFLPEYIQMELIEKIPQKLWDCLDEDLDKNLLSVEVHQTKIEDQIKAIREEYLPQYEHDLGWKEYVIDMILDHNNIKGINYSLEILGAPSIKLKKLADILKQYELTYYLRDLSNQIEKYHDDFRFLLLEENFIDKYIEKHLVDEGMSSEDKKNACARQKYELQSMAIESIEKFEAFLSEDAFGAEFQSEYFQLRSSKSIIDIVVNDRLRRAFPKSKMVLLHELFKRQELKEARIREDEQQRIRRSFSHHIKNMIAAALINPLELIRSQGLDKEGIIDKALRGANLLREIVNAMNLSYSGTKEDFLDDVLHPDEKARSIAQIMEIGLKGAFASMMDGKYFDRYYSEYYPEAQKVLAAKKDFSILPAGDMDALLKYGRKHLIDNIEFDCPEKVLSLKIGTKHNSALKMIIFFQEICMNAVKNSAFLDRQNRFLKLNSRVLDNSVCIEVVNTYKTNREVQSGDSLVGESIIKDLMDQMGFTDKSEKNREGQYVRCFEMPIHLEQE